MLVIGFTGSRQMPTLPQRGELEDLFKFLNGEHQGQVRLLHGACVGCGTVAAEYAVRLGWHIVAYPANNVNPSLVSSRVKAISTVIMPPEPALKRNRIIVDECDMMVATPKQKFESDRGGTWVTIRYMRRVGRKSVIIWPDGVKTFEDEALTRA